MILLYIYLINLKERGMFPKITLLSYTNITEGKTEALLKAVSTI